MEVNKMDSLLMLFVVATMGVDAGTNLFDDAWTTGSLYSINDVVSKLGDFASIAISVVGFGIVIFSILKNAMSGLYVVNPTFWDKVDELKNQTVDLAKSGIEGAARAVPGKGNAAAQKLGGFLTFLLELVPNVRALTDFDDGAEVDKKQYFTKSLLLLVAQIFIGMLIFFGYPAKIANWVGSGATYALNAVLTNVDPVQVIAKFSDSFTVYTLSTDGTQDPWEQNINKMASSMVSAVGTKYNDMSKDVTQDVALNIEAKLLDDWKADSIRDILGASEGYQYSINTAIQTVAPSVSSAYKQVGSIYQAQATNGTFSFKYWISAKEFIGDHSRKVGDNDYMVWTVTATPVAIANVSDAGVIVFANMNTTSTERNTTLTYTINGFTVGNGDTDIKGAVGRVITVTTVASDGTAMSSYNATIQTASVNNTSNATPMLSFSTSDKSKLNNEINGVNGSEKCAYLKLSLVGDWSKVVKDSAGKASTTVRITEIRLTPGSSSRIEYGLSTWTDITDKTTGTGVKTLTSDTLKRGSVKDATGTVTPAE